VTLPAVHCFYIRGAKTQSNQLEQSERRKSTYVRRP
jgi:hypothetical protein